MSSIQTAPLYTEPVDIETDKSSYEETIVVPPTNQEAVPDREALFFAARAKLVAEWERDRARAELDAVAKKHSAELELFRAELAKQHLAQVTSEQRVIECEKETSVLKEQLLSLEAAAAQRDEENAKVKKAMLLVDREAQADVERMTRERDIAIANLELSQTEVSELQAELDAVKKALSLKVRARTFEELNNAAAAAQQLASTLSMLCTQEAEDEADMERNLAALAAPPSPVPSIVVQVDKKRSSPDNASSSSSSASKKKRPAAAKKAVAASSDSDSDDAVVVLLPSPTKKKSPIKDSLQKRALKHIHEQCSDASAPKKCKALLQFAEMMHEKQLLIDAGAAKMEEKSGVATAASIANVIVPHDLLSPALRAMLAANGVSAVPQAPSRSLQEHGRKTGKDAYIILVQSVGDELNLAKLLLCRSQMVALLQGHPVMTIERFIDQLAAFNRERFVYNIDAETDLHDEFLAQLSQTQTAGFWHKAPTPQMFCVYPPLPTAPGSHAPRSAEALAVNLVLKDDTPLTSTCPVDGTVVIVKTALDLMQAIDEQLADY